MDAEEFKNKMDSEDNYMMSTTQLMEAYAAEKVREKLAHLIESAGMYSDWSARSMIMQQIRDELQPPVQTTRSKSPVAPRGLSDAESTVVGGPSGPCQVCGLDHGSALCNTLLTASSAAVPRHLPPPPR